jgi:hypothetical protein
MGYNVVTQIVVCLLFLFFVLLYFILKFSVCSALSDYCLYTVPSYPLEDDCFVMKAVFQAWSEINWTDMEFCITYDNHWRYIWTVCLRHSVVWRCNMKYMDLEVFKIWSRWIPSWKYLVKETPSAPCRNILEKLNFHIFFAAGDVWKYHIYRDIRQFCSWGNLPSWFSVLGEVPTTLWMIIRETLLLTPATFKYEFWKKNPILGFV